MTKSCAVPKCKTGYKSVKQKCSVFRVPKNIEQYQKWQAAIPGSVLKQSQYVCEKHFEEEYIVRQWIKRDANGRIIAQSPYQHPKLHESAVPTIFEISKVMQESTASVVHTDHQVDNILSVTKFREFPDASVRTLSSMDGIDPAITHNPKAISSQEDSVIKTEIISPHELVQQVLIPPNQREIVLSNEFVEHEVLPPMKAASSVPNIHGCAAVDEVSVVLEKNFEIRNMIYDLKSECSITVPKSWRFEELLTQKGQRIVFSRSVMKQENGVEVPVTEKSVIVETDRTLRYGIYGRAVNPEGCDLAPILEDTALLPNILDKFKNMNACCGLGAVNVHYLSADNAFKDCVDRWRPNDCMLLSKRKRCDQCMKMRQRLLKRNKRSEENHTVGRLLRFSNPIDQKNLLVLRKRSSCERRLKNRAKLRGQLLKQSLKDKADEMASIRAETLKERCSRLNIPAAQKTIGLHRRVDYVMHADEYKISRIL